MSRKYIPIHVLQKRAAKRMMRMTKVSIQSRAITIPPKVSLRDKVQEVYDQGEIGSCTANAFCGAFRMMKCDGFKPSRLFLYYQERLAEDPAHNPSNLTDSGADVVDGAEYVETHGICSELSWPYVIAKFNVAPPPACLSEAQEHKISGYQVLSTVDDVRHSLADGHPVLLGTTVYSSFETAHQGHIPMPKPHDQILGGHEMVIVGYDDRTKLLEVLNSWGPKWGDHGFCWIPYDYLTYPSAFTELTLLLV